MPKISKLKSFIKICEDHNNKLRQDKNVDSSEISQNSYDLSSSVFACAKSWLFYNI